MSIDAPVYNAVLKTAVDVDTIATKLRRHRPDPAGERYLQVIVFWFKPGAKLSQRNLAQAWCGILARHAGTTHGEMWAAICTHLLGTVDVVDPISKRTRTTYRSSTTLRSREDWTQFVNGIEELGLEFYGIKLPAGNDPLAWAAFRGTKRIATEDRT